MNFYSNSKHLQSIISKGRLNIQTIYISPTKLKK